MSAGKFKASGQGRTAKDIKEIPNRGETREHEHNKEPHPFPPSPSINQHPQLENPHQEERWIAQPGVRMRKYREDGSHPGRQVTDKFFPQQSCTERITRLECLSWVR